MYLYCNDSLPDIFKEFFKKVNNRYNTRQKNNIKPELFKSNIKKFSVKVQGPKIWNSLNAKVKLSPSIYSFKSNLKNSLISKY